MCKLSLSCLESNKNFCTSCNAGYGLIYDSDNQTTGKCANCEEGCSKCNLNYLFCESCMTGYILEKTGKCIQYSINSKSTNSKSSLLNDNSCDNHFGPILDENGTDTGECGACPALCDSCEENAKNCTKCKTTNL